ncbi:DUF2750 domain-containing protein [Blastopirellula marina]|uniref:DUF2750 domain-containing protein n=1 Tax=Blastopirellula marina TaxID=124 RepID=A0A2S8F9D6_9BACT|nr:DUF2750 domain-containing protein [Blastopirellula marina]PQO28750.1 hypothetical protein C5Y98_23500 [Blastopirellula marina]PTL42023.1 DUF2750 domain-containing protein [Blastopirellula marina]
MSYQPSEAEIQAVTKLEATRRYRYFLAKVADWQEVWSLHGENGWSLLGSDDDARLFPVWPAKAYAESYLEEGEAEGHPQEIDCEAWRMTWLPGLSQDRIALAIFPIYHGSGVNAVVVEADRFAQDLADACKPYEESE